MAINWFRGGGKKAQEPQEYSVDDLIVLERYDEALTTFEALRAGGKAWLQAVDAHAEIERAGEVVEVHQDAH